MVCNLAGLQTFICVQAFSAGIDYFDVRFWSQNLIPALKGLATRGVYVRHVRAIYTIYFKYNLLENDTTHTVLIYYLHFSGVFSSYLVFSEQLTYISSNHTPKIWVKYHPPSLLMITPVDYAYASMIIQASTDDSI